MSEATAAPEIAYVGLGSNLGDRKAIMARARAMIAALPNSRILAESAIEETAPLGPVQQPNYLNQMVAVETTLAPAALLESLLGIERQLGRERSVKWGPRTIDLDIVRYGERTVNSEGLTIPHPQLPHRDFWQRELIELRGDWR